MPSFRQISQGFGVDRAVVYAMGVRVWQIPSGVITALLIAVCFDSRQQGIYMLLLWLAGLQALVDAGLLNTILHAASHEAAQSRFDSMGFLHVAKRSRGRLAGLARFAIVWFGMAAILLASIGTVTGIVLLRRAGVGISQMGPLFAVMGFVGLTLTLSPLISLLEGCNQVQTVNRYRLGQAVTGSLIVWAFLSVGAGLWAVAAAVATQFVWELAIVIGRYRRFFIQLLRTKTEGFSWREEVWPLQWRIGAQSIFRYVAFLPVYPVLFDVHGPGLAGRYGLTWQILNGLLMVSYAYVRTKSPEFGLLIAEKRRSESKQLFLRATLGSSLLLLALTMSFCAALWILATVDIGSSQDVTNAFLEPSVCVWLAIALLPMHVTQCLSMYIRAQKFDPIWRVSIPACIILAGLSYLAAKAGSMVGIAAAMMLSFGSSAIALSFMVQWYDRYFSQRERLASKTLREDADGE